MPPDMLILYVRVSCSVAFDVFYKPIYYVK